MKGNDNGNMFMLLIIIYQMVKALKNAKNKMADIHSCKNPKNKMYKVYV